MGHYVACQRRRIKRQEAPIVFRSAPPVLARASLPSGPRPQTACSTGASGPSSAASAFMPTDNSQPTVPDFLPVISAISA